MSNQLSIIICVVFGIISWYYFNKFRESENEYAKLHKRFEQSYTENQKMKSRIKDLQCYKNDVSKTFKILDSELLLINDHLKRESNIRESTSAPMTPMTPMTMTPMTPMNIGLSRISSFTSLPSNNNVSLLTPELLTSLFNMNSEGQSAQQNPRPQTQPIQQNPLPQQNPIQQNPIQQQTQPVQQNAIEPQTQPVQQNEKLIEDNGLELNIDQTNADNNISSRLFRDIVSDKNNYDQFLINN